MKLFELAGINDFSEEMRKINADKLFELALRLEKDGCEEFERCFRLSEIFYK